MGQDSVRKANAKADAHREELESTVAFLRKQHCPNYLLERIRHWIHYTYHAKNAEAERCRMLANLPSSLSQRLAMHFNEGALLQMDIFRNIHSCGGDPEKEGFVANLLLNDEWEIWCVQEML
jgi:hypothetical protein